MENAQEISLLEHRLSTMESQLEVLTKDIRDLDKKTTQLVDALLGNELSNTRGLSKKITDLESKVLEHEDVLKKVKYFWWGVAAVGSLLAIVIEFFLSLIK